MAQGPGSIPGEVDPTVVTAAMGSQQRGTTTALHKGTGAIFISKHEYMVMKEKKEAKYMAY